MLEQGTPLTKERLAITRKRVVNDQSVFVHPRDWLATLDAETAELRSALDAVDQWETAQGNADLRDLLNEVL